MMLRIAITLLMLLVVSPIAAQQTWTVRLCGGTSPVDFQDLPAAVAAAAAGDTIMLIGDSTSPCGTGGSFTATVIDKPLTIVGVAGNGVPVTWFDYASVNGLMQVTGLMPGERVVFRGLYFMGLINVWPPAPGPAFGFEAVNCAGEVVFDRVRLWCQYSSGTTARFVNCPNVVMHDCELILGENPVELVNSDLLLTNCLVRHSPPWVNGASPITFFSNSVGLRIDHSTARLVGSTVYGADAYPTLYPGSWGVKVAAVLDHGTLEVGPGSLIKSGSPLVSSYYAAASGGSVVFRDPRGTIDNNNTPYPIPKDLPAVLYDEAAPGESFDYIIAGPPNGFAIMVFGNYRSPALPTSLGDVWLDPASIVVASFAQLDGIGHHLGSMFVPAGVGSPFVYGLQALTLSPTAEFGLTSATPFILGWQSDLLPY